MSAYSHINLVDDVENSVGDRVEGLDGRFGRSHLDSRDLGVSLWRYAPGLRAPFSHRHGEQEEAYVVVSGSGRVRLDDEVRDLRQWDVLRVAPSTLRGFEAGDDGLEIIAVGGPRPADGDGEPAEEPWPDGE